MWMVVFRGAKRLLLWITISAAARAVLKGAENLADGKDIWGKKYVERKKPFVTWNGNIVAGRNDYAVR